MKKNILSLLVLVVLVLGMSGVASAACTTLSLTYPDAAGIYESDNIAVTADRGINCDDPVDVLYARLGGALTCADI